MDSRGAVADHELVAGDLLEDKEPGGDLNKSDGSDSKS